MQGSTPLQQEHQEPSVQERKNSFVLEFKYLRFCILAVAMSILANVLLPAVTDSQVPYLSHPDYTGML